jgi:hypothetical protein
MSPEEQACGSFVRFEPPDICLLVVVGNVDASLMRRMTEDLRRVADGKTHVFLLMDHSNVDSISAEARKVALEATQNLRIAGGASFGASFTVRVLVSLLARAHSIFWGEDAKAIRFFRAEAEARRWIEERRRALGTTGM